MTNNRLRRGEASRSKSKSRSRRRNTSTTEYIDTHCHLSYPDFAGDLPAVIERAAAAGVGRIISIATDLASARATIEIAERFAGVAAAVGLHPNDVPAVGLCDLRELRGLASAPQVVAIGETGLDYYREARDNPTLQRQQQDLFWGHLELAKELQLPVIIHNRSADADLLAIVRRHAPSVPADRRPWGVMHCFAGDVAVARECVELGLLLSFTGILTFKNAAQLRAVAVAIPLEAVMLETDAPFLAPVPHRGARNEPAYIPLVARALAELKGLPVEEVARATTANAERLFKLNHGDTGTRSTD